MSSDFQQGDMRELQVLDHNLQQMIMQKQSLQLELNETLNALSEIDKTSDEVYRVIGPAMMRVEKSSLRKELEERKKLLTLRIESFEKQESIIESKKCWRCKNTFCGCWNARFLISYHDNVYKVRQNKDTMAFDLKRMFGKETASEDYLEIDVNQASEAKNRSYCPTIHP